MHEFIPDHYLNVSSTLRTWTREPKESVLEAKKLAGNREDPITT